MPLISETERKYFVLMIIYFKCPTKNKSRPDIEKFRKPIFAFISERSFQKYLPFYQKKKKKKWKKLNY